MLKAANVLFLVLRVSPTWLVKKQLAFYSSLWFPYLIFFHLKFIFVSVFDYRSISFFNSMVCWISFPLLFAENLKKQKKKKVLFKLLLSFDTV